MRPRSIITLVFVVLVAGLGVLSFYGNVLGDREDGGAGLTSSTTEAASGGATSAPSTGSASVTETAGMSVEQVVPVSLAGLPVTQSLDGEAAKLQTEQLHGKALGEGFDAAWIAQYGQQGEGTLWVSRSAAQADAQTLMDRMSERIQAGQSPFENFQTGEIDGVPVVSLDGMGQKHYYFRVGPDLYWLAVIPGSAEAALNELLTNAREVAAR